MARRVLLLRPARADRGDSPASPPSGGPELMANEIAETYTCARDGTISVVIENTSRGYARSYDLGALR